MTAAGLASRSRAIRGHVHTLAPGLAVAATVSLAAAGLAQRYDAPAMLFALLLGMALSFLAADGQIRPGLDFAGGTLLKTGVALLGLAVSVDTFRMLGITEVLGVVCLLAGSMAFGIWLGRRSGWSTEAAVVAAGAVSICGASAALALTALVQDRVSRTHTMAVIMIATGLSTLAMVFYPVILHALGLSDWQTGFVIGASIHDVAQVIGAGFSVSDAVGETATLTKMLRVALLPVVLLVVSLTLGRSRHGGRIALPWFVLAFVALFVLASAAPVPEAVRAGVSDLSRALFLVAIAGIGLLSNVQDLRHVGARTFGVLLATTSLLFGASILLVVILQG
ncbi:YeiH family protein [Puniceibacterium confluentis]|uniref:YeiH family protein n=1 Tax=Puniceibacterium confluentis TaxID=1958944 RepID=UPI001644B78E|nr:putative sulfate exporter family transporter [Puniceibacterium confluentis]